MHAAPSLAHRFRNPIVKKGGGAASNGARDAEQQKRDDSETAKVHTVTAPAANLLPTRLLGRCDTAPGGWAGGRRRLKLGRGGAEVKNRR